VAVRAADPHDGPANFVPVNTADNWLHLALGVGMIALGVLVGRQVPESRAARGPGLG
jgi:hypothetical protein